MKSQEPEKTNRIGPVNPFTVGSEFVQAATKLGWLEEEQQDRQRRYFITPKGFQELAKLGMDLQRVAHYRPLPGDEKLEGSRHQIPRRPHPHRPSHPSRRRG